MRLTPPHPPEKVPHPLTPIKTGVVNPSTVKSPEDISRPPPLPAPSPVSPVLASSLPAPGEGPPLPPEEALARLALSLGLPREDLSTALLGFVRYFSLPLEPGLLHRLRREALLPRSSAKSGGEAGALAAAAATAKGLRLTGEALAVYAAAIDPGYQDPPEGDPGGRQKNREKRNPGDPPPEPGVIKKAAEEAEADSPLLKIVNRLPGKNQEQWTVLPFSFVSGGLLFRVSLRILLKKRGLEYEAERLALDISLASRRWLFVLNTPKEEVPGSDLYVSPFPEGMTPESLEREIRKVLGPIGVDIYVKNPGKMSFFADSQDKTLRSVNKEV